MFEIPLRSDLSAFDMTIELELATFAFKFTWNERVQRWSMTVADADGNSIVSDIPVLVSWPILDRFKSPDLPKGEILFIDTSGKFLDPLREDLGTRVVMIYRESTE